MQPDEINNQRLERLLLEALNSGEAIEVTDGYIQKKRAELVGKIMDAKAAILAELWEEHQSVRFPAGFRGKDINGIDFVMLDADIAGCVSTYLATGTLSLPNLARLGLCYRDIGVIIPVINEEAQEYFWRLSQMAEYVLRELASMKRPTHATVPVIKSLAFRTPGS